MKSAFVGEQTIPRHASVVIIGGGVIGTSIAFHLGEAGVSDIVLLERDELGSGSTSRGAGGVRAMFSDRLNIQLGLRSLEAFARFETRPGHEIDFRRVGYLFLLSQEADVKTFETSINLQNELGVESRMITATEAKKLSPLIVIDGLLAAAFSPGDGYCSPESVVQGYAAGARFHSVSIERQCTVVGIDTRDGKICSVNTTRGTIETGAIICAAGAWSAEIGAMVGLDLPVTPYRRQVVVTEALPDGPMLLPMTIDFATTLYFHAEGPGLLVGMSDPCETPGFKLDASTDWLPRLSDAVGKRAPSILDAGIRASWAGLYEISPDNNAILGEAVEVSRLLYATGFSGHGFLEAPAVGEIIRDLYLSRDTFVDVSPLSLERFRLEKPRPELNCV